MFTTNITKTTKTTETTKPTTTKKMKRKTHDELMIFTTSNNGTTDTFLCHCSLFFFLQKSSTSGDNWFGFCSNQIDTSFKLEKVLGKAQVFA